MDKHISLARELGCEGQELRDYLKRQQDLEKEERLAQREYEREKREADHKEKDREMKKFKIEAEVELKKKLRPRPLHIPGGPKRKVQILGIPSFHTLTNIRIRWIAI